MPQEPEEPGDSEDEDGEEDDEESALVEEEDQEESLPTSSKLQFAEGEELLCRSYLASEVTHSEITLVTVAVRCFSWTGEREEVDWTWLFKGKSSMHCTSISYVTLSSKL